MSFSKSTSRRFLDEVSAGPPVGSYDITRSNKRTPGSVIFEKDSRFKEKNDMVPGPADTQAIILTEKDLNVSNVSNHSFVIPSTPLTKRNRVLSSSASDLVKDEITKRVHHLENKATKLEKTLLQVNKEKEVLTETIKGHQQICETMQSVIEKKESDIDSQQTKINEQEHICSELRINLNGLTQQLESVNKENDSLNDNIFNLEKSIELLETQIRDLKTELCKTRNEKADLEEQMEFLENTTTENLRCLTLKFEGLEEEHENVLKEFKEKEKILNTELELTKISNNNIREDYEAIKNAYKVLKGDYSAVVSEADDLTERCKKTETMLAAAEEKYVETSRKLECQIQETEKEKSRIEEELENAAIDVAKKEAELIVQSESIETLTRLNEEQAQDQETLFRRLDRLTHQIEDYELKIEQMRKEHQSEMYAKDDMLTKIKEELGRRIVETQTKLSSAEHVFKSKLDSHESQYKLLLEENESLKTSNGLEELKNEVEIWRNKFEDLQSKIKPFQSQLEQFENERLVLLSDNSSKENEIAHLADRYAQILGHQNNKQKIRHVIKIKEENLNLKKELSKLRACIAKERNSKKQGSPGMSRKPKFDHTKAFQHSGKENQIP